MQKAVLACLDFQDRHIPGFLCCYYELGIIFIPLMWLLACRDFGCAHYIFEQSYYFSVSNGSGEEYWIPGGLWQAHLFCWRKIHFTSNCYYIFPKNHVQIKQRKRCKTYSCRNFYFVATTPTHAERIVSGSWCLSPEEGVLLHSYVACPRDRNLFFPWSGMAML